MKRLNTISAAILILSVVSCQKEIPMSVNTVNENITSPSGAYLRWYTFRDLYLYKVQNFTPNASTAFKITGAGGTELNFPAGAFVDGLDTTKVITGNIDLTLTEVNTRKDHVLNGHMVASTTTPQMIVGGEIQDIMASQNGSAIKVNPSLPANSIPVYLPSVTRAGSGLSAWYLGNSFTWINGGPAPGSAIYNFSMEKKLRFGMLSSDYSVAKYDFFADAQITVAVTYEDSVYNPDPPVNNQITIVKLIYKDAPSVVSFGGFNYNTESVSGPVSKGRDATIVAYSGGPAGTNFSTPLYFATKTVRLQAGQTYRLDLKKIDRASLDVVLNSL